MKTEADDFSLGALTTPSSISGQDHLSLTQKLKYIIICISLVKEVNPFHFSIIILLKETLFDEEDVLEMRKMCLQK